jgi:ribose transport system permease protein
METALPQSAATRRSVLGGDALRKLLAFAGLILLIAVFSFLSPEVFPTARNAEGILLATAVNGILALGVTFVIITAGIDLSVGTTMTFTAVMAGLIITNWGFPVWLGVLGAILSGALAGLVNGFVIAKMKIPPFIATLGMLYVTRGMALVFSELRPIYFNDSPAFQQIAMGSVFERFVPAFGIPNAVLVFFAAAIVASIILNRTILGRYTFALGSNEEATRLSGVLVDRWKMLVYMLSGAFAGLGGVVMASRLNSAQPSLGAGYELEAIAAVVIGGTSLSGGDGSILGTVIGAFVISVLANGLRILSVPQEIQYVITGVIVVLAVWLDVLRRRRTR